MKFLCSTVFITLIVLAVGVRIKHHYVHCLTQRLMAQLHHTFFCGYRLSEVYLDNFFQRYRHFVDYGFCYTVAALTMLALKHEPSARIIDAFVRDKEGKIYPHAWVEFRYRGILWTIDPCWCQPFMMPRWCSRRQQHLEIRDICSYQRFWSYPISEEFYAKMRYPETSYLFRQLWQIYSHYNPRRESFHPQISSLHLLPGSGLYSFYEQNQFSDPRILFSKQIMDDFMKKSTRLRPKARTIRQAKASRKAWQKSQSTTSKSQSTTADPQSVTPAPQPATLAF